MSKRSTKIEVSRTGVVDLFTAMGFRTANKWTTERLTAKLAKFDRLVADDPVKLKSKAQRALSTTLVAAAKEGFGVVLTGGKAAPAKGTTSAKKSTAKKTTAKKSTAIAVNSYGHREGTKADRMDKAFVKGGTPDVIAKASGATRSAILAHKAHLAGRGNKITESKNGRWQMQGKS